MDTIDQLVADIMADEQNIAYTKKGIKPLFTVPSTARINIVGQAPGIRAQESGLYWNDPSGDNLRKCLGLTERCFTIQGFLRWFRWIIIFLVRGNQGTCRLARALPKNGTSEPSL